jgi:uncharacterized RDD family membrane protein YckC
MSWYYADNGRQAGPVDDATLDALISQGTVRHDTLVWREGMANWQALQTVRPIAPPAAPVLPPSPAAAPVPSPTYEAPQPQPAFQQPSFQQPSFPQPSFQQPSFQQPSFQQPSFQQPSFQQQEQPLFQAPGVAVGGAAASQQAGVTCANCGQVFPQTDVVFIGSSYVCAACKPIFLQRMREGNVVGAVGARRYAGFWIRFGAYIIDAIIVGVAANIVVLPVSFAMIRSSDDPMASLGLSGILWLFQIALACGYFGYFLSTRGATPGKLLLGLQVIRSDGSGITFARGAARYLAQIVSGIILAIGYIIAAFDVEKRALHDHLCDTRVVYK